jgi:hypothetical protein
MRGWLRAGRGLAIGLSISVLNLLGMLLMVIILGGLGEWSARQFVGVFGIFEIATAFAFIICPNLWRLPVIEAETDRRTDVALAASVVFIPHWAGGAKAIAGVAMVAVAADSEGAGAATFAILPFTLLTAVLVAALSAAAARWGVARPDLDVVKVVLRRPSRKDVELPGISITASFLQIVLGAFTLPVIEAMSPSSFYRPEVGPSPEMLWGMAAAAGLSVALAVFAWRGRLSMRAPREQQRKAEDPA